MLPRNYLLNTIAAALKEAHEAFNDDGGKETHEALDRATREICNALKRANPNVDRERFHRAAGYGSGLRFNKTHVHDAIRAGFREDGKAIEFCESCHQITRVVDDA